MKIIKDSEDVIADDKELYRYLGLPVAYSDECESLAFLEALHWMKLII